MNPQTSVRRPNLLVICDDQHSGLCCGFQGHPLARTPHLDALAAAGTNFRTCYSNSPVCVAARAALFTGRFPHEVGAYDNAAPFQGQVPTFAQAARAQGYLCRASGKLDFWTGKDYGFEEDVVFHGHDVSPDITALFRNPLCYREDARLQQGGRIRADDEPWQDRATADRTLRFIRERAAEPGRPWLAYTGWGYPHNPYRASRAMLEQIPLEAVELPHLAPDWCEHEHPVMHLRRFHGRGARQAEPAALRLARACYYAMITEVDALVGDLLRALEETGQRENTIILFTSDHGDMLGEQGLWHKNAPYDPAARVPLVVAGPGIPAGRTVANPVSQVDVCATLLDLVGAPPDSSARGQSLLPLARGDRHDHPPAYMELNTEGLITGVFTLVRDEWKYNYYVDYPPQLFNLRDDPWEQNNRAEDPETAPLREELHRHLLALVNPEQVHEAAFADQARRRHEWYGGKSAPEIVQALVSRLGPEQSQRFAARIVEGRG
ncbi:MAG: sulfatase-like hydrolase/transferase [Candidatus Marinimicrobia bacterium]|nr:sulfatase-like hydrolase/transferase [Candidatus Neomarinimicrobiota bacterium]